MTYIDLWKNNPNAHKVALYLKQHGSETRIVGGAVRDSMQNAVPHDCDMATTATPDDMMTIAHALGIKTLPDWNDYKNNPEKVAVQGGLKHGTVSFIINGEVIEVTTLRQDINTDGRHADTQFIKDFKEDARRRDFTFNACSVDMDGKLYDYFGGKADLDNGNVCFVGDAEKRIKEDYLRILRFFRFSTRYGHPDSINNDALQAIIKNAGGLKKISGERIQSEMFRILEHKNGIEWLNVMQRCHVLDEISLKMNPLTEDEISDLKSIHTASAIMGRLCVLHPEINVPEIMSRWRMSKKDVDCINFIQKYSNTKNDSIKTFEEMTMHCDKGLVVSLLDSFSRYDDAMFILNMEPLILPINGNDVKALGYKGKEIREVLDNARKMWFDSNRTMDKDELIHHLTSSPKP